MSGKGGKRPDVENKDQCSVIQRKKETIISEIHKLGTTLSDSTVRAHLDAFQVTFKERPSKEGHLDWLSSLPGTRIVFKSQGSLVEFIAKGYAVNLPHGECATPNDMAQDPEGSKYGKRRRTLDPSEEEKEFGKETPIPPTVESHPALKDLANHIESLELASQRNEEIMLKLTVERDVLQKQLLSAQQQHEAQFTEIKQQHEMHLNEMQQRHQEQLNDIKQRHEAQLKCSCQ